MQLPACITPNTLLIGPLLRHANPQVYDDPADVCVGGRQGRLHGGTQLSGGNQSHMHWPRVQWVGHA